MGGAPLRPEFTSSDFELWCKDEKIEIQYIQPGKPMQNGYVERCNGSIRRELLNAYVFTSLKEVREKAEQWRLDYNTERPHKSLGFIPPEQYHKNPNSYV